MGGGPALVAAASRLHAAGVAVTAVAVPELYPESESYISTLQDRGVAVAAGGDIVGAVVGHAVVVLADELAIASAGSPLLTALLSAAKEAGVTLFARYCDYVVNVLVGAGAGAVNGVPGACPVFGRVGGWEICTRQRCAG